jgi:transposase-like protein
MPWLMTNPMDERVKVIAAYLRGELSLSRLWETFGVSRKTWRRSREAAERQSFRPRVPDELGARVEDALTSDGIVGVTRKPLSQSRISGMSCP